MSKIHQPVSIQLRVLEHNPSGLWSIALDYHVFQDTHCHPIIKIHVPDGYQILEPKNNSFQLNPESQTQMIKIIEVDSSLSIRDRLVWAQVECNQFVSSDVLNLTHYKNSFTHRESQTIHKDLNQSMFSFSTKDKLREPSSENDTAKGLKTFRFKQEKTPIRH